MLKNRLSGDTCQTVGRKILLRTIAAGIGTTVTVICGEEERLNLYFQAGVDKVA